MNKETEILLPFGVYFHGAKGFAVVEKPSSESPGWVDFIIDKNERKRHPLLRLWFNVVTRGSGAYFMHKQLKNYTYLGEL